MFNSSPPPAGVVTCRLPLNNDTRSLIPTNPKCFCSESAAKFIGVDRPRPLSASRTTRLAVGVRSKVSRARVAAALLRTLFKPSWMMRKTES